MPTVAFVDQDGRPRTFESFKGSTVVLTFIYTSCPMPTFCPLMDRHFVAIQERLKADRGPQGTCTWSPSASIPTTDTPAVLKKHAEMLGADPTRWTFLTGDRDDVDQFAMRFGVSIVASADRSASISPTTCARRSSTRRGRLVKVYTGNEWTPAADPRRPREGRWRQLRREAGPPPLAAFTARGAAAHRAATHTRSTSSDI